VHVVNVPRGDELGAGILNQNIKDDHDAATTTAALATIIVTMIVGVVTAMIAAVPARGATRSSAVATAIN